ncbi:MAG TPA: hypothetical protein VII47_12120 [Actinomycetota bacterium]
MPAAGLLLALGTVLGLREVVVSSTQPDPLTPGLVAGLAMLAAAGLVGGLVRAPVVVGMALAAPGAWVIVTDGGLADVGWVRLLVGVGAAVGGVLAAAFDRRWRTSGAPPIVLAVSVAGLYGAVPETMHVSVLLGVALPVALLGLGAVASLGSAGAYVSTALLAWTAGIGGAARPSSIVGGLGCLGLLVVEPLARNLAGGRSGLEAISRRWGLIALAAIQVVLVAIASRVAGVQRSAGVAALVVFADLGLATALAVGGGRALMARGGRSEQEV